MGGGRLSSPSCDVKALGQVTAVERGVEETKRCAFPAFPIGTVAFVVLELVESPRNFPQSGCRVLKASLKAGPLGLPR